MSVLKLPLLVDQQEVGELVLSMTSYHSIIILENSLNWCLKYVVVANLTTGITFLIFTCMHVCVWGIIRRWSACAPPMKWSAIAGSLRNTVVR
jgi:hypothetical protein